MIYNVVHLGIVSKHALLNSFYQRKGVHQLAGFMKKNTSFTQQ